MEFKAFKFEHVAQSLKHKRQLLIRVYFTELEQYIFSFYPGQQGSLQSPKIFARKACLTFQYISRRWWSLDNSRMFVYVKDYENKQLLPIGNKILYYDSLNLKWNTMKIPLNVEHGFTKVSYLKFKENHLDNKAYSFTCCMDYLYLVKS